MQQISQLGDLAKGLRTPREFDLKAIGIWLQNFHRIGKTDSWRAQTKSCAHQDPEERSSDPTREWARLACECPGVSGGGMGWQWLPWGHRHWIQQSLHKSFWRRSPLLPLPYHREGTQPHLLTENWIKDLLSMALPIRTRPSFLLSRSLPSGRFHKPFILIHQREDRMETTITEN